MGGRIHRSENANHAKRVTRVTTRAEEALGDASRARRWLRKPNRALQGRRPLDLLGSDAGVRVVEQLLGRIEHGLGA